MKKFFIISILLCVILSCHKRAVPTFTTRSIDINETANTKNDPPDLGSGKSVFSARCHRCHDLPNPSKYTEMRLDTLLPIMTSRARLTKEEADNVTAYLKANCSK